MGRPGGAGWGRVGRDGRAGWGRVGPGGAGWGRVGNFGRGARERTLERTVNPKGCIYLSVKNALRGRFRHESWEKKGGTWEKKKRNGKK